MPIIPELLSGHVTLEVECLDRLYLNGYIGPLATSGGLVTFMREQLGKPVPWPVALGHVSERFREAVKNLAEWQQIPIYQFAHGERKDDTANKIRHSGSVAVPTGISVPVGSPFWEAPTLHKHACGFPAQ